MRRALNTFLLAALITGWCSPAAARAPGRRGPLPHRLIETHAARWGVSDDTLRQIGALAQEARPIKRSHHQRLREARRELHALLDEALPNQTAVMNQLEVINRHEVAMRQHALTVLIRIRALLTPAQRRQLQDLMRHHRRHDDALRLKDLPKRTSQSPAAKKLTDC